MNLHGLSDSVAGVIEAPAKCRQCGATTRLGNGLCLSCTLREGLDSDREASRESFEAILAEDEVHDTHWRVGNYEILEEIGRGGMGVIYRARQRHSRRIVALKRMVSYHADSRETRERFRREAEAAASLDHPNILPIYEVGHGEDGLPFFSMKYAAGGSLQKAGPALRSEPRECVRIMAKVARAVQYAHEHGVLHRDLKPGNILLDARGEPLVTDFGLAKWLDTSTDLTRTLTIFGTPGYIAPEQAKGPAAKLTPAADVYSLGAVLFDLFTGRPPFLGEHALAVIQQASEKPAPKLRSLSQSGGIDRDLETICARCLEREPQARYRSAGDLARDLERWLEGRPIIARRVSPPMRVWRWSRRNPTVAIMAALLLGLGATVGIMVWKNQVVHPAVTTGIAVLPFENLSNDRKDAAFADGLQDDILTKLARIADLKVISRTSVMQYHGKQNTHEIGKALHVSHVLEGSVRKTGARLRTNVQLIDTRTDTQVWAEQYDRDLNDVFAVQSEIAKTIADQLRVAISPTERSAVEMPPTTDIAAWDLYEQAQALYADTSDAVHAREKLPQMVQLLDQAVARDPTFLLAWCLLSRAHLQLYFGGVDHTPGRLELAHRAVQIALRLRPEAGEPHLAFGDYYYHGFRDYERARSELAIARRTLPNNAEVFANTGYVDYRQGRWEEATGNLERAVELDPRNFFTLMQMALCYQPQRRYTDELRIYDRLLTIEPGDPQVQMQKAQVAANWKADIKPFQTTLARLIAEHPNVGADVDDPMFALCERTTDAAARLLRDYPSDGVLYYGIIHPHAYWEGVVARWQGDNAKARMAFATARHEVEETLQKQPDFPAALSLLGLIDAGLGRKEEAIREARRACELLPMSKDAVDGVAFAVNLAQIYAWTGEKDLAIEQLAAPLKVPNDLHYGELRLHPLWDVLRGDPRFEKIVASLAPK